MKNKVQNENDKLKILRALHWRDQTLVHAFNFWVSLFMGTSYVAQREKWFLQVTAAALGF